MLEVFKLAGKIFIKDEATKAIDDIDGKADKLGTKLGGLAKKAGKFGLGLIGAATAAGGALLGFSKKTSASLDRIDKLSQRLGMSREAFQEWDFVLSQSGVDIESMQSGMKNLSRRMDEAANGAGKGAELFKRLKVEIQEGASQEDTFRQTITALQEMEQGAEKAAIAQELFGRSGQELLPLLNDEAANIDALIEKSHELGLVQSDEAVDAGVVFADTLDQTTRMLKGVGTQIGSKLLPMFMKFLQWILDNMPTIEKVSKKVFDALAIFVETTIEVISSLIDWLYQFYLDNEEALTNVYNAFKYFFEAIWDIIDIFIALFSGDWEGMWEGIKSLASNILSGIFELIKGSFKLIMDHLRGLFSAFKDIGRELFENVWKGIKGIWGDIAGWIGEKVGWIADKLAFWKDSSDKMDKDDVPRAPGGPKGIPALGNGGIIKRAGSVIVGDRGKELVSLPTAAKVTPLDRITRDTEPRTANIEIFLDSETIARKTGQQIVDNIRVKTAMAY